MESLKKLITEKQATIKNQKELNYFLEQGFAVTKIDRQDEKIRVHLKRYTLIKYDELIEKSLRERYSINAELAILRQRDTKQVDFDSYNTYAEECKIKAKEYLEEREAFYATYSGNGLLL